jgi:hypothetical protein
MQVSRAVVIITLKGDVSGIKSLGRLANSKWRLEPMERIRLKTKVRFAPWTHFYPDNAVEQLYYLEMNYAMNTVNYQHKTILIIQGKRC